MKTSAHKINRKKGYPTPLGTSYQDKGINFALFSQHAEQITLCLFSSESKHPFIEIPLDPDIHKTGWVWHILLNDLPSSHLEYGYKISGHCEKNPLDRFDPKVVLSDPYSRGLNTSHQWGYNTLNEEVNTPRSKIIVEAPFDWQNDKSPRIPAEEVIIYEMHVRSFTQHPSSHSKAPGTFLGIVEKIPHLKTLGINAIELMPLFEFDECELRIVNPKTKKPLKNIWGYSTINFFSPMNRYSSSPGWTSTMDDFRTLVREMHKNKIEVYLDVVYNHTAEGNPTGPCYSFRGIDNQVYYMLNPDGTYRNYSGTGNTFNANHPVVTRLILDSLRYWVSEMHVDGFRFDLASCLTRDDQGHPLSTPPLIHAITHDPLLADSKLIAEAWDAGGLYQVGSFPGEGRWAEWNGKYRDTVRKFIKGTDGESGNFANVMSGSSELYSKGENPSLSINFVTAHDGYSLHDLVSYQDKHNEENGEENRDGTNQNDSWNCGVEGATKNHKILTLRKRQMRNFHCALMLAIGTPMALMGDEYGHTRKGNNNVYCQDNELNWFLWDELEKNKDFFRFFRLMINFRKENNLLHRKQFLSESDVQWHGFTPLKANWNGDSRFVAYTLKNPKKTEALYIAFNAHFQPAHIQLPPPPKEKKWYRVVDTSLSSPHDFCEDPKKSSPLKMTYDMPEHSTFVAKAL